MVRVRVPAAAVTVSPLPLPGEAEERERPLAEVRLEDAFDLRPRLGSSATEVLALLINIIINYNYPKSNYLATILHRILYPYFETR